jgi:hypothetical protein
MKRYKATTKADALSRMWVTAVREESEWVPNFQSVERNMSTDEHVESPNRNTLRRWWKARDRSQDEQNRAVQTQHRSQVAERGAVKQAEGMLEVLMGRLSDMVDDKEGWEDADMNMKDRTQAAMNMLRALGFARPLLASADDAKPESGKAKAARFAEAAQRTSGRTK